MVKPKRPVTPELIADVERLLVFKIPKVEIARRLGRAVTTVARIAARVSA